MACSAAVQCAKVSVLCPRSEDTCPGARPQPAVPAAALVNLRGPGAVQARGESQGVSRVEGEAAGGLLLARVVGLLKRVAMHRAAPATSRAREEPRSAASRDPTVRCSLPRGHGREEGGVPLQRAGLRRRGALGPRQLHPLLLPAGPDALLHRQLPAAALPGAHQRGRELLPHLPR